MTFSRIVPALLFTGVVIAGGACSSSSSSSAKDAGSGGAGGATNGTGGADGSASDTTPTDTSADVAADVAGDGGGLNAAQMRGLYLTGLLGCVNCHTPKLAGNALDTANLF